MASKREQGRAIVYLGWQGIRRIVWAGGLVCVVCVEVDPV